MSPRAKPPRWILALALACAAIGGCAGLPRIDPTGERVFIWPKDQPPAVAPFAAPTTTIVAPPVLTDPVFPAAPIATASPASVMTVTPGATPAAIALAQVPQDKVGITPERVLAPVGSEVVLKSNVCTVEGYTLADQKVEWMLGRNGVGQFVEVSGKGLFHPPLLPWNKPKKIDNYLATGYTASDKLCITRGTADPADDVNILRGDAWVSVTSPNEGTSYVTAFMPGVESWEQRRSSATIYWVDVQWVFPPGTVASDGRSASLTTTVTRQTNGTPIEGWLVRYELADGGGSLAGATTGQVVEVRTDANGQATVVATPTAAGAASTPVNVQLIRPAGLGGSDSPRLVVGAGTSLIQWSGSSTYLPPNPGVVTPGVDPPTPAPVIPTNPGTTLPGGWGPQGGTPITPGGGVGQPTAPAGGPELELVVSGTPQVAVGGVARVRYTLRNTGTVTATNVHVLDTFDRGLIYQRDPSATYVDAAGMTPPLSVRPGEERSNELLFDVTLPGQLCHDVRVTCAENEETTNRFCMTATDAPPQAAVGFEVIKEVRPVVASVGETVRFRVVIKNTGDTALTDVRIADDYPPAYFAIRAPAGMLQSSGVLTKTIPRLERNQQDEYFVDARCLQAKPRDIEPPLVRVEAQTDPPSSTVPGAAEAQLEIRPINAAGGGGADPGAGAGGGAAAPGGRPPLTVTTRFSTPTARVNTVANCEVAVVNSSTIDDQDVALRVVLPPQLEPELDRIQAPSGMEHTWNAAQRQLSFAAIASLQATKRVIVQIPLTVQGQPGIVDVETDVRSRNSTQPAPQRWPLEITTL